MKSLSAPWVPGCEADLCFSNVPMFFNVWLLSLSVYGVWSRVSRGPEAQVSAPTVLESKAKNNCAPLHQKGRRIWWCPKVDMKNHQTSSQSPGQQELWKLVPRQPKSLKNAPWNHEKSNFCETRFLQYLLCHMLGFPIPSIQIQTQNASEKWTWKQA